MREIKFRAWDNSSQEMCADNSAIFVDLRGRKWVLKQGFMGDGSQYELMQFTGLKDKNGKEIYEGDIVKHRDNQLAEIRNDEIIFENGGFIAKDNGSLQRRTFIGEQMEIIGNIYESIKNKNHGKRNKKTEI